MIYDRLLAIEKITESENRGAGETERDFFSVSLILRFTVSIFVFTIINRQLTHR